MATLSSLVHELRERIAASSSTPPSNAAADDALETRFRAVLPNLLQGLRPPIPKHTHPKLVEILGKCWEKDPALRPDFSELIEFLQQLAKEVGDDAEERRKSSSSRFFSALRRGHH